MPDIVPTGPSAPMMKETVPITFQCPTLTSSNYTSWSIKMESIMDAHGLWDAIDRDDGVEVDSKIGKRARAFILQTLPEDILLQVASYKDAKEIWKALRTRFLGADRVQKAKIQTLNRELELLTMKDSESIDDIAGRITELVMRLNALGLSVSTNVQVKKLLNSVPDRFLPIVASIEQYADLETMPFEEAIGRLKTYEDRVKPRDSSKTQSQQLLMTNSDTRSTYRGRGRGQSTYRSRGRSRGRFGCRNRGNSRPAFDN